MQKKLFTAFSIILLLGILTSGILYLGLIRTVYMNELETKLVSNIRLIESFIEDKEARMNEDELRHFASEYGDRIHARITFIDAAGNVLADTLRSAEDIENHYNRPEIQSAYNGEIGKASRFSKTVNQEMFYVAAPVAFDNQDIKVIRLAVNLVEIQATNRKLYYYIGISIVIGLFASLALASRFISKMMRPIREMTEITQKIASGDLNRRVNIIDDDEIGELAENFNYMANQLKDNIDKLSDNNTKFMAVLTSIINPIIAVDNKHRIILLNPAAEALFKIKAEEAIGKHIIEVIRNNVLDQQIQGIFENPVENQIEIAINDHGKKILKIYTTPIKLENDPTRIIGIVALMEDVTEIRKLEKMRSDFVANVSHELKTPLTSISGFVETLKSGEIEDEATTKRFLDIIDIETERLTRLIEDILSLSEIENSQARDFQQEILTSEAIREVTEIIAPIAVSKEIELMAEIEANLPSLKGNSDWFKQMLINLLDNAIKYTPNKGRVSINAYEKYNNIVIVIRDTGIGIPKKDIPRLFERFYRVDKARSRKVGGTGLGLAIVKHIVLSLKGRIKVSSEVGKGTEFTVILPKSNE